MVACLYVGIGGFIGSVSRYLIGLLPYKMDSGFPIKTLLINIFGAFLISVFAAWIGKGRIQNDNLILLLKVGICGGFTTFSTFAYETTDLMVKGSHTVALSYMLLSVTMGVLAIYAGQHVL